MERFDRDASQIFEINVTETTNEIHFNDSLYICTHKPVQEHGRCSINISQMDKRMNVSIAKKLLYDIL